jgi:acetyltransferase-like isoleucine patch superfamily enzyme
MAYCDFLRKIIFKLIRLFSFNIFRKIRGLIFFKSRNIKLGKNVTLQGQINSIKLGKDINVYNNCIFEFGSKAHLEIGSKVIFSFGCIINVNKVLIIGDFVQIGEYTSIRDTTHDYNNYGKPMMENRDVSDSILIGNNVWIGKNCLIMPGSVIEDGVVVGANSIIKGILRSNKIYAGNPIREITSR